MEEPERQEDEAADAHPRTLQTTDEAFVIAPKAYAFDGWSMVPLEIESV